MPVRDPAELRVTIGTRVRVRGALHDADGVAIGGVPVTAEAKPPTGVVQSDGADEVNGTAGLYEATFDGTVAGRWHVRFECSNPPAAAETSFYVEASNVE